MNRSRVDLGLNHSGAGRHGPAPLLPLVLLFALGCAPSGPTIVPVTGKVLLDGKPVAGAAVLFKPTQEGQYPATGETDAQGQFRLVTRLTSERDGACLGAYQVSITKARTEGVQVTAEGLEGDTSQMRVIYEVPQKYALPERSGLTQEVTAAMPPVVFELKSS